jgi:hypothetical protein
LKTNCNVFIMIKMRIINMLFMAGVKNLEPRW